MSFIKNYQELVDHGFTKERELALQCIDAALEASNTYKGTHKAVRIDGNVIKAGNLQYDLDSVRNIYVVGAGKGSFPIAKALDEILGRRIAMGVVGVKGEEETGLSNIETILSGHPVPDIHSHETGLRIEKIAQKLSENDLVFVCVTGGCSALMVLPVEGISLEDKIDLNKLLLRTGAPIHEMNAVRKHISKIKGGGLLKMLQPAMVITLTQDTAPEFLPWPDPVLADPSTFQDAVDVLKKYDIWDIAPVSVRDYLTRGLNKPEMETLKSTKDFNHIILDTGNPRDACLKAVEYARSKGYESHILSTSIEGESKDVGSVLAGIAKEIQLYGRPFKTPCVLVSAGETRVSLSGNSSIGEGGPNQELVLGFAMSIEGYKNIVLVSIDSEGTDGPTEIAGGITDTNTVLKAREMKVDLFNYLKRHDSSNALRSLNDAVLTGPTGTNVVNLRVLVIGEKGVA